MVKGEPREAVVSVGEGRDGEGRSEMLAEEEGMCPGPHGSCFGTGAARRAGGTPGREDARV